MKTAERDSLESPEPDEKKPEEKHGPLRFLRELPGLILLAFLLALLIKTFLFQAFYIPSGSMEPTLEPSDRVLVNKIPYYLHDPRRGDIVVFADPHPDGPSADRGVIGGFLHWLVQGLGVQRPEHEDFIKRVIGLPGETIEAHGGHVFVDGERLREPYLPDGARTADFGPVTVPRGMLFVMGDNRANSLDSRVPADQGGLGFVPIDKVVGKAFVVIWPPSHAGLLH